MQSTESLTRNTVAVADTLTAMIEREQPTVCSCRDYDGYLNPSDPTMITADDRKKLVEWCYHFVDHCQLSQQTVASAIDMVDRFLFTTSTINYSATDAVKVVSDEILRDQNKLQLLTITALYVAIKVNERVVVSSDRLAEMCRRVHTTGEIEEMERILLSGLSWKCHAPTAHQVGLSILSLVEPYVDIPEETWEILMEDTTYSTEVAVFDYFFSTQRRSTVALAAIYNAIGDMRSKGHQEQLRAFLSMIMEGFDFDHVEQINEVRGKLQSLITKHEERF